MTKPTIHGNAGNAGFSLLELIFVLSVVMVLAAMTIPATRSAIASYKLDAAVDSATGAIQGTRYQAIMHGYPYQVDLNATTNTFQVASDSNFTSTFSPIGAAVPICAPNITINAGATNHVTLQFKPNGSVTVISGQSTPVIFTIAYNGTTKHLTVSNYGSISVSSTTP